MSVIAYNPGGVTVEVIGNPVDPPPIDPPPVDPPPNPGSADFATRSTGPGVVRFWTFDDPAQLGGTDAYGPVGCVPGVCPPHFRAVIDPNVKCSGNGSMRFDVPATAPPDFNINQFPNGFQDSSGFWYGNFADDLSRQFGENSEFFVQVRVRFNKILAESVYHNMGGKVTNPKLVDIAPGDQRGGVKPHPKFGITYFFTSDIGKLICIPSGAHRFPIVYHYYPRIIADGTGIGYGDTGLYESSGAGVGTQMQQNAMPNPPGCLAGAILATPQGQPVPGCWTIPSDEWFTLKYQVKLGLKAFVQQNATTKWEVFDNSEIRFWAAYQGQPSQLLVEWTKAHRGANGPVAEMPLTGYAPGSSNASSGIYLSTDAGRKFGKVILMPFMTGRSPTEVMPGIGQVWYDELIVSTQDIPDPA